MLASSLVPRSQKSDLGFLSLIRVDDTGCSVPKLPKTESVGRYLKENLMKAIKYERPWNVECVEQDMPVCGKGQALIRIMTAGICGSDIGAFRGTNGLVSYPRVIGHELAGII